MLVPAFGLRCAACDWSFVSGYPIGPRGAMCDGMWQWNTQFPNRSGTHVTDIVCPGSMRSVFTISARASAESARPLPRRVIRQYIPRP